MDHETKRPRRLPEPATTEASLLGFTEALSAQRREAESRKATLDALDDKLVRSGLPVTFGNARRP
jgi:hypothetical protein